jgi:hypothetical protein
MENKPIPTSGTYIEARNYLLSKDSKTLVMLATNLSQFGFPVGMSFKRAMIDTLNQRNRRVEGWNK